MLTNIARDRVFAFDVERLECRALLSGTIDISAGYHDSTQAIQNALNQAGGGGAVDLAPGAYNISSQVTIPSGVRLEGNGKATLNWTGGEGTMLYSPWDCIGTTVDGLTLSGAGYKLDPGSSGMTISNNTFENISYADPYDGNGLYIPDVMRNSTITNNTFSNITGNVGIYIFNAINVQITSNTFNFVNEPIKGQWDNGGSNDLIASNTLNEVYRFGIECQGDPDNLTISNNTLGNWQQRDSHIGLSIATGEGNNINILNNTILGTGIGSPSTAYAAIEAMGNNLTISGNFASGWGWAELVGYTDHWATTDNTWGVNTAIWVTEAGGTNPSVDSNNTSVELNATPSNANASVSASPPPAPVTEINAVVTTTSTSTASAATAAPTAATTPAASTTTTPLSTSISTSTSTTTSAKPSAPKAIPAPAVAPPVVVVPLASGIVKKAVGSPALLETVKAPAAGVTAAPSALSTRAKKTTRRTKAANPASKSRKKSAAIA